MEILQESQILKRVTDKLSGRSSFYHYSDTHSYESSLRVMTEPLFHEQLTKEKGWKDFLSGIQSRIPSDKFEKTKNFFEYPLQITSLSNEIAGQLNTVWSGRNANFNIEYPTDRARQGAEALLSRVNVRRFVEDAGKKAFRSCPQIIVVADKDMSGVPYLIALESSRVYYAQLKKDSECDLDYIIFSHSMDSDSEKIAYYDSFVYAVLVRTNTGALYVESINSHSLGYCPARYYVDIPLSSVDKEKKWNPFASSLGKMSIFQQFIVYSIYAEHYGVFPVVEYAKPACDNEDCENGQIKTPLKDGGYAYSACSCKSNSIFNGAGTAIEVSPAYDKDENDTRGYFRFISPDIANLEYEDKKQKGRESEIKLNITGYNDNLNNGAVNVQQVQSVMADRKRPLEIMSGIASRLHEWCEETLIKLLLDVDVKSSANYGSEWYLMSEKEIQELFDSAKKSGLPDSEIDQLYKLLVETKYKGQPQLIRRIIMENALNPLPYKTLKECRELLADGVITLDSFKIKANIKALIRQFELENGSILEFGMESGMSFEQKIELINNTFLNYISNEQN